MFVYLQFLSVHVSMTSVHVCILMVTLSVHVCILMVTLSVHVSMTSVHVSTCILTFTSVHVCHLCIIRPMNC